MEIKYNNIMLKYNTLPINYKFNNQIIGTNKSIFAKVAPLITEPYNGTISLNDTEITKKNKLKLRVNIGYINEMPFDNIKERKVYNELLYGMRYFNLNWHELNTKIDRVLNIIGLDKKILERTTKSLSLNELKRIHLGQILMYNPKIIIFDKFETTFSPREKEELKNLIKHLKSNENKTILVVSEDINFLYDLADKLLVFDESLNIVIDSPPKELKNNEIFNYMGEPEIFKFISYANDSGINLEKTNNINDLIKDIYRNA